MLEVETLGETMLRLSPVAVSTLEETQQLQVAVGAPKQTIKGDFFWGGKQEVDRLITGSSTKLDR